MICFSTHLLLMFTRGQQRETVAELVQMFLLPEVQKLTIREKGTSFFHPSFILRGCRSRAVKTSGFHTGGPGFESRPDNHLLGQGALSSLPILFPFLYVQNTWKMLSLITLKHCLCCLYGHL